MSNYYSFWQRDLRQCLLIRLFPFVLGLYWFFPPWSLNQPLLIFREDWREVGVHRDIVCRQIQTSKMLECARFFFVDVPDMTNIIHSCSDNWPTSLTLSLTCLTRWVVLISLSCLFLLCCVTFHAWSLVTWMFGFCVVCHSQWYTHEASCRVGTVWLPRKSLQHKTGLKLDLKITGLCVLVWCSFLVGLFLFRDLIKVCAFWVGGDGGRWGGVVG